MEQTFERCGIKVKISVFRRMDGLYIATFSVGDISMSTHAYASPEKATAEAIEKSNLILTGMISYCCAHDLDYTTSECPLCALERMGYEVRFDSDNDVVDFYDYE